MAFYTNTLTENKNIMTSKFYNPRQSLEGFSCLQQAITLDSI